MKVLYLAPPKTRPDQLTLLTFIDEEIRALSRLGVRPYILSPSIAQDEERDGIIMKALPARKNMAEYKSIFSFLMKHSRWSVSSLFDFRKNFRHASIEKAAAELIEEEDIDLVHSHFGWPGGFGGALAARATSRPLIASFRGMDVLCDEKIDYGLRRNSLYDKSLRYLAAHADRNLCVSEYMRREILKLGAVPDKTWTLLKGVDTRLFNPQEKRPLRQKLGIQSRFVILTVASLTLRKGIADILEALSLLKDSFDFTFLVCGEGLELESLKSQAHRLGLGSRVRFEGWVKRDRIADYFGACDLFVLASYLEAAGNVLLEAMSSGQPVVAVETGGIPEYVTDQVTGFTVPVKDPKALSEKIQTLLENDDLRKLMGDAGRQRVLENFSYSKMIENIYSVTLQNRKSPGFERSEVQGRAAMQKA